MGSEQPVPQNAPRVEKRLKELLIQADIGDGFEFEARNALSLLDNIGKLTKMRSVVATDEGVNGQHDFLQAVKVYEAGLLAGWDLFDGAVKTGKTPYYAQVEHECQDTGETVWARFWFIDTDEDEPLRRLEEFTTTYNGKKDNEHTVTSTPIDRGSGTEG